MVPIPRPPAVPCPVMKAGMACPGGALLSATPRQGQLLRCERGGNLILILTARSKQDPTSSCLISTQVPQGVQRETVGLEVAQCLGLVASAWVQPRAHCLQPRCPGRNKQMEAPERREHLTGPRYLCK